MNNKILKFILIILDGFGLRDETEGNAYALANTPIIDSLFKNHPMSSIQTSGKFVGLPDGIMGNSEVGHMNIGAGRIVYQDLVKINNACLDGSIAKKQNLQNTLNYAKEKNKPLHLMGLVSDAGVHSHQDHLYKLCELAKENDVQEVFVHAFTDGRDCNPNSGKGFIEKLEKIFLANGKHRDVACDNRHCLTDSS